MRIDLKSLLRFDIAMIECDDGCDLEGTHGFSPADVDGVEAMVNVENGSRKSYGLLLTYDIKHPWIASINGTLAHKKVCYVFSRDTLIF
jgi:hypothetical protein